MSNHLHLLIETPDANLGKGMQSLHGRYAQRMNERYGTKGHFFESRYGCVFVENDAQLWMVIRYIALNPVAAGLCAQPEDYEWSSYGRVLDLTPPAVVNALRLLRYLSAAGGDPLQNYRNLVNGDF